MTDVQRDRQCQPGRTPVRVTMVIFLALFLTYAYSRQWVANANIVTRAALTLSIIREGKLTIDPYQEATIDKSFWHGHYYCDKAPGLSLVAIPAMSVGYAILRIAGKTDFGLDSEKCEPSGAFKLLIVFSTVFTSALATAVSGAVMFLITRKLGATLGGALFATASFGLASPAWFWACAFFGHALAAACLFAGFAGAVWLLEQSPARRPRTLGWIAVGLLLGFSVVVEYPLALGAILVGAMVVVKLAASRREQLVRAILGMALGVVPCIAVLMLYHWLAFDSPLRIGYDSEPGFEGMRAGFHGLTYPKWNALYGILLSSRRGILWLSPTLVLMPLALGVGWKWPKIRIYLACALLIVLSFLALNASYYLWDGGLSIGPRHITPALPFAFLPFGLLWTWSGKGLRVAMSVGLALSFLMCFICIMVTKSYEYPTEAIALFCRGDLSNIGTDLGIRGYASLLPLVAVWAWAGWCLRRYFLPVEARRS